MRRFKVMLGVMLATGVTAGAGWAQAPPAQKAPEIAQPEEPDYAFVAGGPFTQLKNSIQVIHQFGYGTRRFATPAGRVNEDEFLFFFRTEWGFTDRLELDVITPAGGARQRLNGSTTASAYGYADSTIGIRYRFLDESTAPITLTMGPQVILPTGGFRKGTGSGSAGFAWDVAAAKDWGGPVFLFQSFNYSALPSADDPTPGSAREFALHNATWATALGLRPLERETAGGANHDIHIFLEAGGSYGHEVEPGLTVGSRTTALSWLVSPGVRYGLLTAGKTLIEIGVAAPIGLGPNGPKRGFLIQFQFEKVFGQ